MHKQLKIGDEIYTGHVSGRGGHGAYVIVEKINRKSIKGTERTRSYSPGIKWTIGYGSEIAIVSYDGQRIDENGKLITGLMKTDWVYLGERGQTSKFSI